MKNVIEPIAYAYSHSNYDITVVNSYNKLKRFKIDKICVNKPNIQTTDVYDLKFESDDDRLEITPEQIQETLESCHSRNCHCHE